MPINPSIFKQISYGRGCPSEVMASLDKLTATTTSQIKTKYKDISKSCTNGIGYTLKVDDIPIWFMTYDNEMTTRFTLNPSLFNSFKSFTLFLSKIFTNKLFLEAEISRLDHALTFPCEFRELFMGLDFGRKRSLESYIENNEHDGFYVGRYQRKYSTLVYDKNKQLNRKLKDDKKSILPLTRLEVNYVPRIEIKD